MGDVLPPKREEVERLGRRVQIYRGHHNSCLPRYEDAINNIRENDKAETVLLRQRIMESKSKKSKKSSDHHRSYKDSIIDGNKTQVAKSVKRCLEEPNSTGQSQNNEEIEKPSKLARVDSSTENKPDLKVQQQTANNANFNVQVVDTFSNQKSSLQTNATVQNLSAPINSLQAQVPQPVIPKQAELAINQENSNVAINTNPGNLPDVKCKQERNSEKSEFCQPTEATNSMNSFDSFSDPIASIVSTTCPDDMISSDLMEVLISDIQDGPPCFFENIDSVKDKENEESQRSLDIFQNFGDFSFLPNNASAVSTEKFLSINASSVSPATNGQQLSGIFPNSSGVSEAPASTSTLTTPALTTSTLKSPKSAFLNTADACSSYFDCRHAERNDNQAARTLKQMADQHQNMRQFNPPVPLRAAFNQDNQHSNQGNNHTTNFLNGSVLQNDAKTLNSTSNGAFLNRLPGELFDSHSPNCDQLSPRLGFDMNKILYTDTNSLQMEQQKPPPYSTTRPLNHFPTTAQPTQFIPNRNQHSPVVSPQSNLTGRFQFPTPPESSQNNQEPTKEFKQTQVNNNIQDQNNMYSYHQSSAKLFEASMSQPTQAAPQPHAFPSQFSPTLKKPPPDYKSHHHSLVPNSINYLTEQTNSLSQSNFMQSNKNSKVVKLQRAPNVTIRPNGSALPSAGHNWSMSNGSSLQRIGNQKFQNVCNLSSEPITGPPLSPMYNQQRFSVNQMSMPSHIPGPRRQMPEPSQMSQCRSSMPVPGSSMPVSGGSMQVLGNSIQVPGGPMQVPSGAMQISGGSMQVPAGSMPMRGTQVPRIGNQVLGLRHHIPGPRNQMLAQPKNQIPRNINHVALFRNQVPTNQLNKPNVMSPSMMQQRMISSSNPSLEQQHHSLTLSNNSISPNRTSSMGHAVQYNALHDILRGGPISPMGQYATPNRNNNGQNIPLNLFDNTSPEMYNLSNINIAS